MEILKNHKNFLKDYEGGANLFSNHRHSHTNIGCSYTYNTILSRFSNMTSAYVAAQLSGFQGQSCLLIT